MFGNKRFLVAAQIMVCVTGKKMYLNGEPINSDYMAYSVNTNPVVIRRIIRELKDAGLIEAKTGPNGGAFLTRDASEITLADVYRALKDDGDLFNMDSYDSNHKCVIGRGIKPALHEMVTKAEHAMLDVLAQKSLKEFAEETIGNSLRAEYEDYESSIQDLVMRCATDEASTFEHLDDI